MGIGRRLLLGICLAVLVLLSGSFSPSRAQETKSSACVSCHERTTPGIVADWQSGKMAKIVDCSGCHGSRHTAAADTNLAVMPTAKECGLCHPTQADRFAQGKHSLAWTAMEAMLRTAHQPRGIIEGGKGCGGCHRIGLDSGKCDSCHTRRKFSVAEARNPLACTTCHMGFDHPQWEMWSTAKHGVIYQMEPTGSRAPTCQRCHMPGGDHRVMTAWGFLAVRLPAPDPEWEAWQTTILKGLGVLDPDGKPTPRLELVKAGKVARLTAEEWQAERQAMLSNCTACHSQQYAKASLDAADSIIRSSDQLMAEVIDTVAGLYKDGLIKQAPDQPYSYPDLLVFYDARTPIERKLYEMFLEHRMRTFEGAFHMSPDYMHWYGWAPMRTTLVEIKEEAQRVRAAGDEKRTPAAE